ncbi:uncharacterized protein LOC143135417 isoform X1 [Alosa pseudoharengus]|uniref:uncharacterized protein LOC143135417 isoform X1 n=1 Tax=Alosa pseudoharengus TaxID=34774 RepID=UPI003F89C82D
MDVSWRPFWYLEIFTRHKRNARGKCTFSCSCSVQRRHIHRTLRLVPNNGCPNDWIINILQHPEGVPAIEHVYTEQRNALLARVCLEQMDGKRPHLSGDGRCDSPGFNAKYCHYTFMLDSTKEILHTELVQCTEATSSGAMEPLGFRRGMNDLLDTGLDVEVMATDRSTSIQKIMREEFPNVQHEFDIWHTAKGFRKKLLMKGKKKGNEILLSWNRHYKTGGSAFHTMWSMNTDGLTRMESVVTVTMLL